MRDDLKADLVLDALGMAVTVRGGDTAGAVAHSDHGSQGEFNRSSQRLSGRSCDEREGSEVGSGGSAGDAVAGPSAGRAS